MFYLFFFFSSRRRHTRFALVTGVQTCALPIFSAWGLQAFYGQSYIVQDDSFNVHEGEIVALLGRNGAGKTSTLRTIARLAQPHLAHGEIWLDQIGSASGRERGWQYL